jgi:7-keto-8-aminopelargonate synthetase-like enzyme
MHLESTPNTTATINGKEYLFFSGTSYLGVSMLPEFQELVVHSIKKWGVSYGSSRNANLKLNIYKKGELFLRDFLHSESAVTVSSGTLASQFALRALHTIVDEFYYMPKTHPSILPEKATAVFLDSVLNPSLKKIENKTLCIVVDAIAALETVPFSFDFLNEISSTNTVYVLIDESHSLGVLGANGNGISCQVSKNKTLKTITVSSLGKAFGVNGGVISGATTFINIVQEDPLFIGSAGMSPAFLETYLNAQTLYTTQREKLKDNIAFVAAKLEHLKEVSISKNYPVFFFKDSEITDYLFQKNILITSFYYPATTQKINRIVINANHTKEQLEHLVGNLIAFSQK